MLSHVDFWQHLQTPFSLRFYEAMHNLRKTLEIGITTIRDAGGADLGMKVAVEQGLIPGPRMQISIRMIPQTGGHGTVALAVEAPHRGNSLHEIATTPSPPTSTEFGLRRVPVPA